MFVSLNALWTPIAVILLNSGEVRVLFKDAFAVEVLCSASFCMTVMFCPASPLPILDACAVNNCEGCACTTAEVVIDVANAIAEEVVVAVAPAAVSPGPIALLVFSPLRVFTINAEQRSQVLSNPH